MTILSSKDLQKTAITYEQSAAMDVKQIRAFLDKLEAGNYRPDPRLVEALLFLKPTVDGLVLSLQKAWKL